MFFLICCIPALAYSFTKLGVSLSKSALLKAIKGSVILETAAKGRWANTCEVLNTSNVLITLVGSFTWLLGEPTAKSFIFSNFDNVLFISVLLNFPLFSNSFLISGIHSLLKLLPKPKYLASVIFCPIV